MKYLLPFLLTFALGACDVGAAPSTPETPPTPETPGAPDGTVINQTAGLSAYPGAAGNGLVTEDGLDTRTTFSADASLQEVYSYFDGQLTSGGWQRTNLEQDDDEIEADYSREGRTLELELEQDDGGFELEVDIDGDNAGYDEDDDQNDDGPSDDDGDDLN